MDSVLRSHVSTLVLRSPVSSLYIAILSSNSLASLLTVAGYLFPALPGLSDGLEVGWGQTDDAGLCVFIRTALNLWPVLMKAHSGHGVHVTLAWNERLPFAEG